MVGRAREKKGGSNGDRKLYGVTLDELCRGQEKRVK